ncbi:Acetoacetyl-CoA synthase [Mesorhizobium loti]|nr:Acetoacetyl-CoA synthase [Mesorhizobium loti]
MDPDDFGNKTPKGGISNFVMKEAPRTWTIQCGNSEACIGVKRRQSKFVPNVQFYECANLQYAKVKYEGSSAINFEYTNCRRE